MTKKHLVVAWALLGVASCGETLPAPEPMGTPAQADARPRAKTDTGTPATDGPAPVVVVGPTNEDGAVGDVATLPDGAVATSADARTTTDVIATSDALTPQLPPTSAGCGRPEAPPDGLQSIMVGTAKLSYYIHVPKDYDRNKPYPVLFMFHGTTHSGRIYEGTTATTGEGLRYHIGPEAILIFPNGPFKPSAGVTRFEHSDLPFWDAMLEKTRATLCVDNARVFVAGHSSGAYFAHTLGTRRSQHVRGVAAAAGALGDGPTFTPRGFPAVFVAHGKIDSVNPFSNGDTARKYWAKWNGCSDRTTPTMPSPCVMHEGCRPDVPVVWCPHNETAYSGTGHGWPSFATKGMWAFFKSLPPRQVTP